MQADLCPAHPSQKSKIDLVPVLNWTIFHIIGQPNYQVFGRPGIYTAATCRASQSSALNCMDLHLYPRCLLVLSRICYASLAPGRRVGRVADGLPEERLRSICDALRFHAAVNTHTGARTCNGSKVLRSRDRGITGRGKTHRGRRRALGHN